ncbi:hypothetical protein V491_00352 [Pseudogymnoascus sp. VKM F-3775]|nr:hypothetical protein V491_00352 [Pseudogymnoascus sp. VKM F-3775]
MNGHSTIHERQPENHNLTKTEEEVIIRYILDLDARGFAPRIAGVEDMANLILTSRGGRCIRQLWAHRFVKRQPELKTRFNRVYDFQRALCEDPKLIGAWFQLVENMKAKYGVQDCNFYNFDKTGFMMGIICPAMIVTRADRRGRGKAVQPGNREWATAITDNETGLDWIQHFNKHTASRTKGIYRMLVLDGHESHESAEFQEYCKAHNIITLGLPAHSSHLTQPLDMGCFSVLKRAYGRQIETYVKAHINHITKVEFFIAFKAAYLETFTA